MRREAAIGVIFKKRSSKESQKKFENLLERGESDSGRQENRIVLVLALLEELELDDLDASGKIVPRNFAIRSCLLSHERMSFRTS